MNKRSLKFPYAPPGSDRAYHDHVKDVKVVLSRLPQETYVRLKMVHSNDIGWKRDWPAYTTIRGRCEISLCALPPRISLTRYLKEDQTQRQLGARHGTHLSKPAIFLYSR